MPTLSSTLRSLALAATAILVCHPVAAQAQGACAITALCLDGNRYQVTAAWHDTNTEDQQIAHAVALSPDTGYFWFFERDNVEITVKALDGCSINGHEWVFASGMTNLYVRLAVTDAQTGAVKTYTNPAGTAFAPIQDTAAFENCPGPPDGDVAGPWTGTFATADPYDCETNTPAFATFERDGAAVTGTLSAANSFCGFTNAHFAGSIDGNQLSGTVTGGTLADAHAFGTISGTKLVLTIANGFGIIPGGVMTLSR